MNKVWMDERHVIVVETDKFSEELILTTAEKEEYVLYYEKNLGEHAASYRSEKMLPVEKGMKVVIEEETLPVYLRGIVRDIVFDDIFPAAEEVLGASVQESHTTFSVWSPVAEKMSLVLENEEFEMNEKTNGTWEIKLEENLTGKEYIYKAVIHGETQYVVDPYAKALTPNSTKAVVYDQPARAAAARPQLAHTQDSIIYELHIRDASIHKESGMKAKGKYLGLTELNTKTSRGYSTGLSYIKELGVTHVELLPVNDFGRVDDLAPDKQYNWGYDPLFFMAPEGSYAQDVTDPFARIKELQQMIDAFHKEDLGIILDVVYNHVFVMEESPFEQLVPGYYFRYQLDGRISNGTGVGNDFASERHMGRKFILDAVDYWLNHFKADGFRFDLMGTIDKKTMQLISERCQEEETPILLLGEGWNLPTALAEDQKTVHTQAGDIPYIRFFNDFFRDTVKGSTFDFNDYGFVNGKGRFVERMAQLVKGSADDQENVPPYVAEAVQTVNYVESHDNHTLWDRLEKANGSEEEADRRAMQQLATGLVLMSQGVPFIHAGQEFYRTKKGEGNSYISGDDINALDWERREIFEEDIQFVRDLISIRRRLQVFRLRSTDTIRDRLHILTTPAPVFGYTLLEDGRDIVIYVNPTKRRYEIQLPSSGTWLRLASNQKPGEEPLQGEFLHLEPYEFLVLKKFRR
ncbi:type I pullulanase [Alkalicoccus daliensis]|uniref:Pullulanase n=1 Tax=Alkalicoccus daliensis TaxID=745820 RepID=A0A1H0H2M1_9BACI|nr:type I pullulanase [Alkalicoccus daliensis]SDO13496.1 pullulanase [Alkalicoccus daliensis]